MMTQCKMRDKPLDVQTKNGVVDMTSRIGLPDWSTNVESKDEKSYPRLTKSQNQKIERHPEKQFAKTVVQTANTYFEFLKLSTVSYF